MGWKVKRFPQPPDPRGARHMWTCTDERGAGPWRYYMQCPSATGSHSFYNIGVDMVALASAPETVVFVPEFGPLPGFDIILSTFPMNHTPPYTLPGTRRWFFEEYSGADYYEGFIDLDDKDTLGSPVVIPTTYFGPGTDELGGSLFLYPVPWS